MKATIYSKFKKFYSFFSFPEFKATIAGHGCIFCPLVI